MKKSLRSIALMLALSLAAAPALAVNETPGETVAANPADQFTGKYWVNSLESNKESYLYGIESAIAVEKAINDIKVAKKAKAGKAPVYTLSPFEKGWIEAFKATPRKDIMAEIDKWYMDNPDKLDRPVLAVIWYELIKPRLNDAAHK